MGESGPHGVANSMFPQPGDTAAPGAPAQLARPLQPKDLGMAPTPSHSRQAPLRRSWLPPCCWHTSWFGAVTFLASLLGGCGTPIMRPEGQVSAAEKSILIDAVLIMMVVVVPTILATLVFAWWFRASNTRARYRPNWAYSGRIELITWSVPALIVLFLGGLTWIGAHELDPAVPLKSSRSPLTIDVVSLDWKWLFIYPDQSVASVNQLVIPAGTPVHFNLTSASVMNSFFVPQLGSMIYTMNGMSDQLWLEADRPGVYQGRSAQPALVDPVGLFQTGRDDTFGADCVERAGVCRQCGWR